MIASALDHVAAVALPYRLPGIATHAGKYRGLLLMGCIAAAALAASVGNPAPFAAADADLAWLLRGMAGIKALIVLAAAAMLAWRFGHPIVQPLAYLYVLGTCLATGATVLIWQLSFIPAAAIAFHIGEFIFLITAWRDGRVLCKPPAA